MNTEHYNCQMEKYNKASQTMEYSMNRTSTTNEKYYSAKAYSDMKKTMIDL
jgi:hypothetical protein